MIVTIDGPAGAGKSTVARTLARQLGFRFLDTGAMYRAVTLAAVRRGLHWNEPQELAALARRLRIELVDDRVHLDGEDVTDAIRSSELTALTRFAADNPEVRKRLIELQRAAVGNEDVVTEGRDQGTLVFPQAECKIFLTASPQQRAARRLKDLVAQGETKTFEEVLAEINRRDTQDQTRALGALAAAPDAVEVYTDGMAVQEVVDCLGSIVRERQTSRQDT